jgi:pimeloyl-ACP methyl ester carboxylesterase
MSIDIDPVQHHGRQGPKSPRSGPVKRVIGGSLVAGAVLALVLVLAVFPGATESVITGSVLVAFGLGWTMMAALSVRLTRQPQRWAAVPAVAMTVTGAGLLIFSPQDATLTWLNFLWPPALLTLVVWMFVQMRRALSGRGRWLLTPVLLVLAAASAGAITQDLSVLRDHDAYPEPGRSYSVGDHRLHLDCHGRGGPTVVLFNGLGEISASWARITDEVDGTTRVCAYARAGQAWSDDVDTPQDGVEAAEDLHALLAAAGEKGPFVLVGHSIGGPYALTYAAHYPDQVAGMVLLDSSSPRQLTDIPSYARQYAAMRRGLALLPTLSRLGLGRAIFGGSDLPTAAADRVDAMTSTVRAARNGRDEVSMIPEVFDQAQALTTLGDLPLAVLTTSESLKEMGGWAAAQDRLAELSANRVHRDVHSTHAGLVDDEAASAESVRAINEVVIAVHDDIQVGTDS